MSKIEWTDQTWNPIIGCSKISPGCDNCYAELMANRLGHIALKQLGDDENLDLYGIGNYTEVINPEGKWNGQTRFVHDALEKPLKRKKPTKYFVCSMGDLFHESVPFEWIDKVMAIIAVTPHHTYQILTKRPQRMIEYFNQVKEVLVDNMEKAVYEIGISDKNDDPDAAACYLFNRADREWPFKNLWLGVSAENQEQADKRIPILLQIPAAKRFVSIEPMLGPVDLCRSEISRGHYYDFLKGRRFGSTIIETFKGLDWVILGGESGHKARPMHPDWVRSIRDQCQAANVPFFFKQWGEWIQVHERYCNAPGFKGKLWFNFDHDTSVCKVGKKFLAGIDGKEYNEFPKS